MFVELNLFAFLWLSWSAPFDRSNVLVGKISGRFLDANRVFSYVIPNNGRLNYTTGIDIQERNNMGHEFENKIFNGDCISGMKEIPGESMDIIITDPPFAIDFKATRANYNRTDDRVLQGYQEISANDYLGFTRAWMAEAHRLLKPTAGLFVFSGWNNLKDILIAGDELGLTTVNHIIWKYQFGVVCKRRFVTSHYHCLFYCKDDKKRKFYNSAIYDGNQRDDKNKSMRYKDLEDVWEIKREYWHGDVKTPTKLPFELVKKILLYTSDEGDLVFDPFLGSGQVAVVAKELGRKYLGFEIVTEYFNFAKERLDKDLYRIPKEDKSKFDDLPLFEGK